MWGDPNRRYIVTPVVPQSVSNILREVAEHQGDSVENVAKAILLQGLGDESVLDELAPYFWRDYHTRTGVWPGSPDCRDLNERVRFSGPAESLSIPLTKTEWFQLDYLAYALCRTVHQAASAVLLLSLDRERWMNRCAPNRTARLQRGVASLRNSS
jgi:hypothetical protein